MSKKTSRWRTFQVIVLSTIIIVLVMFFVSSSLISKRRGLISESTTRIKRQRTILNLQRITSTHSLFTVEKTNHHQQGASSYCTSNNNLYWGQLTYNGNLNEQTRYMYETVIKQSRKPFLKKENTFFFTNNEPSSYFSQFFNRITFKWTTSSSGGYSGAQRRFLEALFTMLDIKKQRNDTHVKWFILSDDDHLVIPANLMKTLAKYEMKLERGELSMDKPLIIGRTPDCSALSGGAGVIFNEKAIEILQERMEECIAKIGLQWYDYTIYKCVSDVITKSTREKCEILKHETSMHCCNFMYYCDPSSYNDPPNLSWFNRFRKATGFHYIRTNHIEMLANIIPNRLFTQVDTCFPKEELELELDNYMPLVKYPNAKISEIMDRVQNIRVKPTVIDWTRGESAQQDERVTPFMIDLIDIVYSTFENQFLSKRNQVDSILQRSDISIAIIPSSLIENRNSLMTINYNLQKEIQQSQNYWNSNGFSSHVCASFNSPISIYIECLRKSILSKWTLIVTETTRINVDLLIEYLTTFNSNEPLYVGSMKSAQELIISQLESKVIGLPFGALFAVTSPFVKEFNSMYSSFHNQQSSSSLENQFKFQQEINEKLFIPNKRMLLSGGHFFTHAPEHYCTKGIKNIESWIEMQVPTKYLEPMAITFAPTNNCPGRMSNIHQFFNKEEHSLLKGATGISLSCFE